MGWSARDLVTIGYWPLRQGGRPEWLAAPQVVSPCNVSHCNDRWPKAATMPWLHNSIGLFAADALALAAVPPPERSGLLICGVRALAVAFDLDVEWPWELPKDCAPIPAGFVQLGYDVVQCPTVAVLECSPLLCNHLAAEIPTNRWCLLDALDDAIAAAKRWTEQDAERGPYVVLEVWAERWPDAAPSSRGPIAATPGP